MNVQRAQNLKAEITTEIAKLDAELGRLAQIRDRLLDLITNLEDVATGTKGTA